MINFWRPGLEYLKYKPELDAVWERVMTNGELVMGFGKDVGEFEQMFADFLGVKNAVMCGAGTQALFLAYKALGLKEGDEVITTSHTFIATIDQIKAVGARPVLVDIDEEGLMDVDQLENLITPFTKAIVPVHLEGKVCNMDRIGEVAKKCGLLVIEDAAQAIGASYRGIKAGTMGNAGCFSLYPAKVLGCAGNAGMVVTNDDKLADKIRMMRCNYNAGKNQDIENVDWGYNLEPDNLQAAILKVKLKYLPERLARRKEIAERYDRELKHLPISLPVKQQGRVYQDYVILAKAPKELADFLRSEGVGTLGVGLVPNHKYPRLKLNFNLPNTEEYLKRQIRIPCNPELSDEEQTHVIQKLNEFFKK